MNHVLLTGHIVADPRRATGADGAELTVLLVRFDVPVGESHPGCMEVEVPDEVAGSNRPRLVTGVDVLMAGALLPDCVLAAAFIHPFIGQ